MIGLIPWVRTKAIVELALQYIRHEFNSALYWAVRVVEELLQIKCDYRSEV